MSDAIVDPQGIENAQVRSLRYDGENHEEVVHFLSDERHALRGGVHFPDGPGTPGVIQVELANSPGTITEIRQGDTVHIESDGPRVEKGK